MTRNLVPWGPTMQNLGSLACTVWAVGGVVRKCCCTSYIRRKLVFHSGMVTGRSMSRRVTHRTAWEPVRCNPVKKPSQFSTYQTDQTDQNRQKVKVFNFRVFHPIGKKNRRTYFDHVFLTSGCHNLLTDQPDQPKRVQDKGTIVVAATIYFHPIMMEFKKSVTQFRRWPLFFSDLVYLPLFPYSFKWPIGNHLKC